MKIRKKDVKGLAEKISRLTGPFGVYGTDGTMVYEPAGFDSGAEGLQSVEIGSGEHIYGTVRGTGDGALTAAFLVELQLRAVQEKKSLTAHTLVKYKELGFFSEMSEMLGSSIDLDEILKTVTVKIHDLMGVEHCSIMLISADGKHFDLKTVSGRVINEQSWITLHEGIAGRVVDRAKPEIVNEPEAHPDFIDGSAVEIRNLLCVPLKVKDRIIGVMNLSNKKAGIFTSEDESFMVSISVMVAGAIENARLLDEKIKNEKFSTIGQMAAGIIHDIKNPMTTIKGFAGLMGDMEFTKEERKEYSKMIVDEVNRLVGMVEDLLAFSRGFKTSLVIKPHQVGAFIEEVLPFIEKDASTRAIEVVTEIQYTGGFKVDADRFKRVVFNIAGNAREVMHNGGKYLVLSRQAGHEVELVFSDTGSGIPDDIVDTVFEPFVTKGKKSGTGLGLAITKKIVEEHGGSIRAVNGNYSGVEGFEGANFVIRLPLG